MYSLIRFKVKKKAKTLWHCDGKFWFIAIVYYKSLGLQLMGWLNKDFAPLNLHYM